MPCSTVAKAGRFGRCTATSSPTPMPSSARAPASSRIAAAAHRGSSRPRRPVDEGGPRRIVLGQRAEEIVVDAEVRDGLVGERAAERAISFDRLRARRRAGSSLLARSHRRRKTCEPRLGIWPQASPTSRMPTVTCCGWTGSLSPSSTMRSTISPSPSHPHLHQSPVPREGVRGPGGRLCGGRCGEHERSAHRADVLVCGRVVRQASGAGGAAQSMSTDGSVWHTGRCQVNRVAEFFLIGDATGGQFRPRRPQHEEHHPIGRTDLRSRTAQPAGG